jgi:hypothetical protein
LCDGNSHTLKEKHKQMQFYKNCLLGDDVLCSTSILAENTKKRWMFRIQTSELLSRQKSYNGRYFANVYFCHNIYIYIYIYIFFFIASGVGLSPLYCDHFWPIVPAPDDRWGWLWSNWWNKDWQGKPKYSEKTCPSVTLSTTNPTWLDPGSNPGCRGGKPATNRLSYGVASTCTAEATPIAVTKVNVCTKLGMTNFTLTST